MAGGTNTWKTMLDFSTNGLNHMFAEKKKVSKEYYYASDKQIHFSHHP